MGHLWFSSILKLIRNAVGLYFWEGVFRILQYSCKRTLPSGRVFGHLGGPLTKSHARCLFWIFLILPTLKSTDFDQMVFGYENLTSERPIRFSSEMLV